MFWDVSLPIVSGLIIMFSWWGLLLYADDLRLAEIKFEDASDKALLVFLLVAIAFGSILPVLIPFIEGAVTLDYIYLVIPFILQLPLYFRYGLLE